MFLLLCMLAACRKLWSACRTCHRASDCAAIKGLGMHIRYSYIDNIIALALGAGLVDDVYVYGQQNGRC